MVSGLTISLGFSILCSEADLVGNSTASTASPVPSGASLTTPLETSALDDAISISGVVLFSKEITLPLGAMII